jgi:hypothetical protein
VGGESDSRTLVQLCSSVQLFPVNVLIAVALPGTTAVRSFGVHRASEM